ncbi:hypothetical protein Metev_0450 [Methanohalobium evestigatum Z-7303]|uniref:Uncharacterized protein n=1 Tax=Methanohalobium evestigatum (strain ATCC BAA-1072 / DSM 3721 / NBRC 107634 / OCM 161 / Z-7303) TaxID=644295 RepID=D7E823_METEZ|nr:hypothetical protein [Methanohalobium evestigatum]ADI73365.1 hypothetical protein Metev_0450 [Methanohalobium evestigatum Z-7303]
MPTVIAAINYSEIVVKGNSPYPMEQNAYFLVEEDDVDIAIVNDIQEAIDEYKKNNPYWMYEQITVLVEKKLLEAGLTLMPATYTSVYF